MPTLEEIEEELNKKILLCKKLPEDIRMSCMDKLMPDKKKLFSNERLTVVEKLKKRAYKSSEEFRKDLVKISFDLSWDDLTNMNLSNLDFSNVNLSTADLSGSNFSGCNLSNADLSIARFSNTVFSNANMQGINISVSDFSNADFSGTNLSMSNLSNSLGMNANFMGTNASFVDFSNSNLKDAKFEGANITGANFEDCNLKGTILEGHENILENEKRKYESGMKGKYKKSEKKEEYIGRGSVYRGSGEHEYALKKHYK